MIHHGGGLVVADDGAGFRVDGKAAIHVQRDVPEVHRLREAPTVGKTSGDSVMNTIHAKHISPVIRRKVRLCWDALRRVVWVAIPAILRVSPSCGCDRGWKDDAG
jgi:hypothetical protein